MNTDVNVTEVLNTCFGFTSLYEDRTELIKSNQREEIFKTIYVCMSAYTLTVCLWFTATQNMRHYRKIACIIIKKSSVTSVGHSAGFTCVEWECEFSQVTQGTINCRDALWVPVHTSAVYAVILIKHMVTGSINRNRIDSKFMQQKNKENPPTLLKSGISVVVSCNKLYSFFIYSWIQH